MHDGPPRGVQNRLRDFIKSLNSTLHHRVTIKELSRTEGHADAIAKHQVPMIARRETGRKGRPPSLDTVFSTESPFLRHPPDHPRCRGRESARANPQPKRGGIRSMDLGVPDCASVCPQQRQQSANIAQLVTDTEGDWGNSISIVVDKSVGVVKK